MKIDKGGIINDFIEPNRNQYVIPVYQRNYEWSAEQCEVLFNDILKAHKQDANHFTGSVVYAPLNDDENKIKKYVVIDGQQRLTTVYILIKALIDSAETEAEKSALLSAAFNEDKFKKYGIDEASKLKLKPIKSDNQQLVHLMNNELDQMDKSSGIYRNYQLFRDLIQKAMTEDPEIGVSNIYDGLEHLTCAIIKLEEEDNAQEIFERINSTGIPLSLADKIRNFALMTDSNQDYLYETYWLKIEQLLKDRISDFFMDYLNMKLDSFTTEGNAYAAFKELYANGKYDKESILKELLHYAQQYSTFMNGNPKLGEEINQSLAGLNKLKQTTVYIFLFKLLDDYEAGKISKEELAKVLKLLLNYSIRRLICEIGSNSLRGLYKTLYGRVFVQEANKEHYYDAIVSFLQQITSRDAIPTDDEFIKALKENDLYRKNALCKYLLVSVENQGKEKLLTDNLSIEHIMPQNKNLSAKWQKMLGADWRDTHEKYLHTLGNLTLTGYNSELGDKSFEEKKKLLEEQPTKIKELYKGVKDVDTWNAGAIENRADELTKTILKLFPIEQPKNKIDFTDPRYKTYTAEDPDNATNKTPNYYELLGERVKINNFADMRRSVANHLYQLDSAPIEKMARNEEKFPGWTALSFSYDKDKVRNGRQIAKDSGIYISNGFSAADCVEFIRELLKLYELDIAEDFLYSAKVTDSHVKDEED